MYLLEILSLQQRVKIIDIFPSRDRPYMNLSYTCTRINFAMVEFGFHTTSTEAAAELSSYIKNRTGMFPDAIHDSNFLS